MSNRTCPTPYPEGEVSDMNLIGVLINFLYAGYYLVLVEAPEFAIWIPDFSPCGLVGASFFRRPIGPHCSIFVTLLRYSIYKHAWTCFSSTTWGFRP